MCFQGLPFCAAVPPSSLCRVVVLLPRSRRRTFSVGSTDLARPSSSSPFRHFSLPLLQIQARQIVQLSPLTEARATQSACAPLKSTRRVATTSHPCPVGTYCPPRPAVGVPVDGLRLLQHGHHVRPYSHRQFNKSPLYMAIRSTWSSKSGLDQHDIIRFALARLSILDSRLEAFARKPSIRLHIHLVMHHCIMAFCVVLLYGDL